MGLIAHSATLTFFLHGQNDGWYGNGLLHQHGIAVAEEPVTLLDRMPVCI